MCLIIFSLKTWLILFSVTSFTGSLWTWVVPYWQIFYFWFFCNNTFIYWQWIFLIIFIFSWFINYYEWFVCLLLYYHVFLFLEIVIGIFWYDVWVLIVVLIFAYLLYLIFAFLWLMDINFIFQQNFVLNPLDVLILIFIIIFLGYAVLIVTSISDWVSRAPLKVMETMNNLWSFL